MSQIQRIVARKGLEAAVPALLEAEIGYDTDTKTFRVGDNSATPGKVISDKSTGVFDFSTATSVKFKEVLIGTGGKVDGVDLKTLNTAPGFVVRKASTGVYGPVTFGNSDQTLVITNGDGQAGNVDIRLHPNIVAIITGTTFLAAVSHDGTMTGDGKASNPLIVVDSTTLQKGVIQTASQATVNSGVSTTQALTPGYLAGMTAGSVLATSLQSVIMASLSLNSDTSLSGNGGTTPLAVVQATETQLGGAEIASQVEADNALDDQRIVTTLKLANLGENSNTAVALRSVTRSKSGLAYTSLLTNGSVQTLPLTATDFTFLIVPVADAVQNADAYYLAQTTATLQMNIGGVWQTVGYAESYDSGGAATGINVPYHESRQYATARVLVARTALIPGVSSPQGYYAGVWNGQVRVNIALNGSGLLSGIPVGNAGSVVVTAVYI